MNATRLTSSAPSLRRHTTANPLEPTWRRPERIVLETCVEDIEGVRLSARLGADRAELGDNLAASGTTPSIGTVEAAIFAAAEQVDERRALAGAHWARTAAAAPFGLRVLIRPRGGDYVYDSDEGRAMIADVRRIATLAREMSEFTRPQATGGAGTHLPPAVELGFVIGALTADGAVDRGLVRLLVNMADGAPITFHRAFDSCRDTAEAYGDLGGLGVDYVLTSGAAPTAAEGAEVLAGLASSQGPAVIAAGGVRPADVAGLVERTGVREVHMRLARAGLEPGEPQRTDPDLLRSAVETIHAVPAPA
ncbi:copper homeostasis protein CutC [Actinomyces slackii]|uniref:PF03932 family protein CutC n=1 Tax=Actinomyces slackii TaxID=52774 RepID=A0A448K9Z2_9ACTO|nr:copper homeostasis protein CutC [Actinomyces slackii]VEG73745.1 Copper homeostasis protein CutC [Actinomyces slackii]